MGVDEKILKPYRAEPSPRSIQRAVAYILSKTVLRGGAKVGAQEPNRTEHSRNWGQAGSAENHEGLRL